MRADDCGDVTLGVGEVCVGDVNDVFVVEHLLDRGVDVVREVVHTLTIEVEEVVWVLVIAHCFYHCFFQKIVNLDAEDVLAINHEVAHGEDYLLFIVWAVVWGWVF